MNHSLHVKPPSDRRVGSPRCQGRGSDLQQQYHATYGRRLLDSPPPGRGAIAHFNEFCETKARCSCRKVDVSHLATQAFRLRPL